MGMGRPVVAVPWWGVLRPPFLLLTISCMALAVAWSAWWLRMEGQSLAAVPALLCVLGALLAHAGVNVLNEVHDFRSGLDQHTWRTPFSGGSGALLSHPDKVKTAATLGWTCVVLTAAIGLGLWWWQRLRLRVAPLQRVLAGLLVVASVLPLVVAHRMPKASTLTPRGDDHVAYSAETLGSLRAEGRIVIKNEKGFVAFLRRFQGHRSNLF